METQNTAALGDPQGRGPLKPSSILNSLPYFPHTTPWMRCFNHSQQPDQPRAATSLALRPKGIMTIFQCAEDITTPLSSHLLVAPWTKTRDHGGKVIAKKDLPLEMAPWSSHGHPQRRLAGFRHAFASRCLHLPPKSRETRLNICTSLFWIKRIKLHDVGC